MPGSAPSETPVIIRHIIRKQFKVRNVVESFLNYLKMLDRKKRFMEILTIIFLLLGEKKARLHAPYL
jgi:hypothetical protein